MSTTWNTNALGDGSMTNVKDLLRDDFVVLLLQGKNLFGDMIYCYLKVVSQDVDRLQIALRSDARFNASDYGTVVAAGKGEPPPEVKAEIAATYNLLEQVQPMRPPLPAAPKEKKEWEEW